MQKLLIKLVVGAVSFSAIASTPSEARAQACFVSQQTVAMGPTLIPVSERRNVVVEDWRIAFAVPETYQLSRDGLRMDILPPASVRIASLTSGPTSTQTAHCDLTRSRSVSVSIVNRVVSEASIRSRLSPGEGTYLGLTNTPSGIAFMHTTRMPDNQVHLSIPFPNQPVSVVFTAHADSNGEIFQEGVFETILETFQFRD
ncbi:MAG: hypothetical protein AAF716_06665 [Cyanobacteria bacterium P01_D01_bin.1]